jgi:hypothetical protein
MEVRKRCVGMFGGFDGLFYQLTLIVCQFAHLVHQNLRFKNQLVHVIKDFCCKNSKISIEIITFALEI